MSWKPDVDVRQVKEGLQHIVFQLDESGVLTATHPGADLLEALRVEHACEKLYRACLYDLDSHLLQKLGEVGRVGMDDDLLSRLRLKRPAHD